MGGVGLGMEMHGVCGDGWGDVCGDWVYGCGEGGVGVAPGCGLLPVQHYLYYVYLYL